MAWNVYPHSDTQICKNAEVFIQHLTSLGGTLSTDGKSTNAQNLRLIFRGLSDSTHRLVPTALRTQEEHKPAFDSRWAISDSRGRPTPVHAREKEVPQRNAELHVVQFFYQYAERAGLPLPPISDWHVREQLLTGQSGSLALATLGHELIPGGIKPATWPPKDLLPILGLAQHYGLPTRLLDWSHSPLVAGYFAAAGGMDRLDRGHDSSSLLRVWGTTANSFESYGQLDLLNPHGTYSVDRFPARLVQPPSAQNPNLSLQRGVFTVVVDDQQRDNDAPTDRRELHDILIAFPQNADNLAPFQQPPLFFALDLPISESPRLLLLLKQLGYSANRIYDG